MAKKKKPDTVNDGVKTAKTVENTSIEADANNSESLNDYPIQSWRMVEITQDCSFGWTLDKAKEFLDGFKSVDKYAYILHNQDFKPDFKTPRNDHVTVAIKFNGAVPTKNILGRARAVGLSEEQLNFKCLQRIKSWAGLLNYLTHRDERDKPYKHIYDFKDVIANFNWDEEAEHAHAKKAFEILPERLKEIIDNIDNGVYCEYNIGDYVTPYERVQLDSKIRLAFKYRTEAIAKEERDNMQVIYIQGAPRIGKDTFAVEWCKRNGFDKKYFRTNNNDKFPFDDYMGQPVIIWSDARDDVFSVRELLALLDNHWQSKQKARFADRLLCCKYLIITSIKSLKDWYYDAFRENSEPRKQLYGRIGSLIEMTEQNIKFNAYNKATGLYDLVCTLPNTYTHNEDALDTPEKKVDFAKSILGSLADAANYVQAHITADDFKGTADFKPADVLDIDNLPFEDKVPDDVHQVTVDEWLKSDNS